MALIAFLSLIPMGSGASNIPVLVNIKPTLQNLMHIPAYAALTILWIQVFSQFGRKGAARIVPALLVSTGFGLANEAAQNLIPGRYPGLTDALTNLIGAVLGALLYLRLERSAAGRIRRLICT